MLRFIFFTVAGLQKNAEKHVLQGEVRLRRERNLEFALGVVG